MTAENVGIHSTFGPLILGKQRYSAKTLDCPIYNSGYIKMYGMYSYITEKECKKNC